MLGEKVEIPVLDIECFVNPEDYKKTNGVVALSGIDEGQWIYPLLGYRKIWSVGDNKSVNNKPWYEYEKIWNAEKKKYEYIPSAEHVEVVDWEPKTESELWKSDSDLAWRCKICRDEDKFDLMYASGKYPEYCSMTTPLYVWNDSYLDTWNKSVQINGVEYREGDVVEVFWSSSYGELGKVTKQGHMVLEDMTLFEHDSYYSEWDTSKRDYFYKNSEGESRYVRLIEGLRKELGGIPFGLTDGWVAARVVAITRNTIEFEFDGTYVCPLQGILSYKSCDIVYPMIQERRFELKKKRFAREK